MWIKEKKEEEPRLVCLWNLMIPKFGWKNNIKLQKKKPFKS